MEEYLILKNDGNDLFFYNDKNVKSYFKNKNLVFKIMKKIGLPLNLFFGDWKKNIDNVKTVILFDNGYNFQVAKYIKKKNKNIKCIFWYWNSLIEYNNKIINDKNIDEIWSYNRFDAEKYNLKYNPQFYFLNDKNFSNNNKNNCEKAMFLGRNKGRERDINYVKELLEKNNIICDFTIIENESHKIDYNEYFDRIKQTDIIVDISANVLSGLSLRPLEAIFLKKKLITNNQDILNYKFYNSNNIFVIGIDDNRKLNSFISSEYQDIDSTIINYYSYESWLERILDNR